MTERPADPATPTVPRAPGHASSARPPSRPFAAAALAAGLAVAACFLGPLGARAGLLPAGLGEAVFRGAIALAFAAIVTAILAMRRSGRVASGLAIVVVALAAAALPLRTWLAARSAPPIHDITTDADNPPRYVAVAKLRMPPANSVEYGGAAVARQQRASYGEMRPLILPAPPPRVLALAGDTARADGWTVLAEDIGFGDLGRLEATDASTLFGRIDDIVVRVVPHAAGSRVDVRSSARQGEGDDGRNAARIRRFLAFLAERASAEPTAAPAR